MMFLFAFVTLNFWCSLAYDKRYQGEKQKKQKKKTKKNAHTTTRQVSHPNDITKHIALLTGLYAYHTEIITSITITGEDCRNPKLTIQVYDSDANGDGGTHHTTHKHKNWKQNK